MGAAFEVSWGGAFLVVKQVPTLRAQVDTGTRKERLQKCEGNNESVFGFFILS